MHYSREDLFNALEAVGLRRGDTCLFYVSTGMLGRAHGFTSQDQYSEMFYDVIRSIVGDEGTVVVPTYTYSYCRNEVFDIHSSPSTVGPFTEFIRQKAEAVRSRDPIFSVAGIGPRIDELTTSISTSCFGKGSLCQRLVECNGKVCTIGVGLHYATFRHHIEEMAEVPFRYRKFFQGVTRYGDQLAHEEWIYSVPLISRNGHADGHALEKLMKSQGLCRERPVGRGSVMLIGAREYYEAGLRELKRNPWLSAVGPECDPLEVEEQRVGKRRYVTALPPKPDARQVAEAVLPLPREHVSDGIEQAYEIVGTIFPCTLHRFKTGAVVGDNLVPEKWRGDEAVISTVAGQEVLSSKSGTLGIASYSLPLQREVSLAELKEHLHIGPGQQIPAYSLYRSRNWGLATSQKHSSLLTDDRYQVSIVTQSSVGQLSIAECLVGTTGRQYSYICEIGLAANHERLVADIVMLESLLSRDLRNMYQILFVPHEEWVNLVSLRGERVDAAFIIQREGLT